MVSRARAFLCVSLIAALAAACGGVVALDDIPRDADAGAAGPGLGPGNGSGGPGSGPVGSGGSGGSGGSTSPGSPGTPTPAPTLPPPPPKPPTVIACGKASCAAATQSCCIDQSGGATCISNSSPCAGVALECSSGASCPNGQVCCLDIQGIPSAACASSCDTGGTGPGGQPNAVILCDSDNECPKGMRCRDAPGGVGIKFCQPRRNGGGGN